MTNSKATKAKKSSLNEGALPQVYPMSQAEVLEDGTTAYKRFKPLAYALLCWIKDKGLNDQINLSDDGNSAAYSFTMDSHDPSLKYQCYFELDEPAIIRYYIYDFDDHFETNDTDIYQFLANVNLRLLVGQFQLVTSEDKTVLRYYSSIDVTGIASEDPDYEGPFQIHPLLFERLFIAGADCMNRYLEAFRTGDMNTVGIKLSD